MPWSIVSPEPTTTQPPPLGSAYLSSDHNAFQDSSALGPSPLPPPTTIAGCPRGLEPVIVAEELTIERLSEDEYTVRTASGQILFSASIDVTCCWCCGIRLCGDGPAYRLVVEDLEKREVLTLSPPETSRYGALTSCLQCLEEYDVTAGGGLHIGAVTEEPGCFSFQTKIGVRSADGDAKLFITGPDCSSGWCCCSDVILPVVGGDGQRVGSVTNVWRGCMKETCSRGKVYRVKFPSGLDPITKATLFGAVFVAGHTFFESNEENV